MAAVVPSLSAAGWLTDPMDMADRLLAYFFTSDYSQSLTFAGKISSLQYLIANHPKNMIELSDAINNTLTHFLSQHFDQANIDVRMDKSNNANVGIIVSALLIKDGVAYDISRLVRVSNAVVINILDYNETGTF